MRKRSVPYIDQEFDVSDLTTEEELQILQEAERRFSDPFPFKSIEEMLVSPEGFGLTTATPLQRACCRIFQGLPLDELWEREEVRTSLAGVELPKMDSPPSEVVLLAAVRTAKSLIAAVVAIWAARHCDVSLLRAGEIPRFSILSLEVDNAKVVLAHLLGALQNPAFNSIRVDKRAPGPWQDVLAETGSDMIGSEFLWHKSGRPVEIRVIAGKRAGGSLVSRWSAGCVLDEAPRMVGSSDAVVNYDDARKAVRGRILPGGQILSIGSPYQPYGPIYDVVQTEWGCPTKDRIVIKATGPAMNPYWWTPEKCEEIRRTDPAVFQTDVLAEFADAEEALIPQKVLNASIRTKDDKIEFSPRRDYAAAMDPATRGNAWALVIADRIGRKKRIVKAMQWQGSSLLPLSPRKVLKEIKDILSEYGLDWCYTDQWASDALRDIALSEGFTLIIEDWKAKEKVECFMSMAAAIADGTVELPNYMPLIKDLKLLKKKATSKGPSIVLPHTADGRHCDFAPATARVLKRWLDDEEDDPIEYGTSAYYEHIEKKMEQEELKQYSQHKAEKWWERDVY